MRAFFVLFTCLLISTVGAFAQPSSTGNSRNSSSGERPSRGGPPANDSSPSRQRSHDDEPKAVALPAQPEERAVAARFDANKDGVLDDTERRAAFATLSRETSTTVDPNTTELSVSFEPIKPGSRPNFGQFAETNPSATANDTLHALALEFNQPDWEAQLATFAATDISLPAQLQFAGSEKQPARIRALWEPGAQPRIGYKRSLEITLANRTVILHAASSDPTFMRAALYAKITRRYLPAPRVSFTQVIINGEDWGTYLLTEPLNAAFIAAHTDGASGTLWTVSSGGTLAYLGEDTAAYRKFYHPQMGDAPEAWAKLIQLCKLLAETPAEQLEATLQPHLDLGSTIHFLALENVLINQSGYRARAGGYGLYLDRAGQFHLIPQDMVMSFRQVLMQHAGGGADSPDAAPRDAFNTGPEGMSPAAAAEVKARESFRPQSSTDLAMLLSYSLVNRADRNNDRAVSRDEMEEFARHWFIVMDEDYVGYLTRERFVGGIRNFVAPLSVVDGRTRQTFGGNDPSGMIATDLLSTIRPENPERLTSAEFVSIFVKWNDTWPAKKFGQLTQVEFQAGLTTLLSKTVFDADQTYISQTRLAEGRSGNNGRPDERGGRGGDRGGSGVSANVGFSGIPGLFGGRGGRSRGTGGAGRNGSIAYSYEQLDPTAGLDDPSRPLLSKLLKPRALQARYLDAIREIASTELDWKKLEPDAKRWHELIASSVRAETHRRWSYASFVRQFDQDLPDDSVIPSIESIKTFVEARREFLLDDPLIGQGPIVIESPRSSRK